MFKIKIFLIVPWCFILFLSCTPWVSVIVEPDDFSTVKSSFSTFLFGSYNIDSDQGIYLDMKGAEPDLLLNRVYTHAFAPGQTDYFLIPIPDGSHMVRGIYFTYGTEYYSDPYPGDYSYGFGWGWGGWHHRFFYYQTYPYVYYENPVISYPYPFTMNLERNKIYYFGRITLTNGRFSVDNRFDEDKSALESSYQGNTNAYLELSGSDFVNLLK